MGSNMPATGNKALKYDCDKCIAYCCSIYDRVQVTPRDTPHGSRRIFVVAPEVATQRFTKVFGKEKRFCGVALIGCLDRPARFWIRTRGSVLIYNARPLTCREFPTTSRCAYYDLIGI